MTSLTNVRNVRRGGVVVQVAIAATVILGVGALVVDVGSMYSARAELQAAADAAALASAGQLIRDDAQHLPEHLARTVAASYATRNEANGHAISIDPDSDVILGRSEYNSASNRFTFFPTTGGYNAVKVKMRLSDSNSNGSLALTFANIFGKSKADVGAEAIATVVPRDIALVIDLSASMNFDSETMFWNRNDGGYSNMRDVWAALDGPAPSRPYAPASELDSEYASDLGPTFGFMTQWGNALIPGAYSADSDPGLVRIQRGQNSSGTTFSSQLANAGYTANERAALLSGANDNSPGRWQSRAGALLGLATWRSGQTGSVMGAGGNGDNNVDANEVTWIPLPTGVSWPWKDYIDFVQGSYYPTGEPGAAQFHYRYGIKTYIDYMLRVRPSYQESSEIWHTPAQPLQAVKDSVQVLADTLESQNGADQLSLATFGTTARHEVDLTENVQQVATKLFERQAAHIDGNTNIGGGLWKAINELESSRGRDSAFKIIVLMSDGAPNIDEFATKNDSGGRAHALSAANECADRGIVVYTISVGYGADRALMREIANRTQGREFFASGAPEEYTEELQTIFRSLGGKRPVVLIE
ncbi:MAG: VWA domain-containing protein [Phycisphaerae bacterium]